MIHPAMGNDKLGRKIGNISLPPLDSCPTVCHGTCSKVCYAIKFSHRWPVTQRAWENNLTQWEESPDKFRNDLTQWIDQHRSMTCFRWHVGGDIPELRYWYMMEDIAEEFRHINFLVFTKTEYPSFYSLRLNNLSSIYSAWPGIPIPERMKDYPISWQSDDTRQPLGTARRGRKLVHCPGSCQNCKVCWFAKELGADVMFPRH